MLPFIVKIQISGVKLGTMATIFDLRQVVLVIKVVIN